jgi:hypothetical protein
MTVQAPTPAVQAAPAIPKTVLPTVAASPLPATKAQPVAVTVQMPPDDHLTDWVNIGVSGSVGLIAALLGAYIGWRLTKKSSDEAREREERQKNAFASFVMMQKLGKIYSCLTELNQKFVDAAFAAAADNNEHVCLYARAPANELEKIEFDYDELYRTGKICQLEFINSVTLLDAHFNSVLSIVERYTQARNALMTKVKGLVREGGVEIRWTPEEYEANQPELVGLGQLLEMIIENTEKDRPRAHAAIVMLHKGTGKYLKRQNRIDVRNLEGVVETIFALDEEAPKK